MKKSKGTHYVKNADFLAAMIEYKGLCHDAEQSGEDPPRIPEYIGKCFVDIATNLAWRPNFINYPYREEMIGDGIENCLMYCSNFDPDKSKNPFSYFTQIIYYAFLRRIQKEKKQNYIKYKMMEITDIDGSIKENLKVRTNSDNPIADMMRLSPTDIEKFEPKKKKTKKKQGSLDEFLDNEDSTD